MRCSGAALLRSIGERSAGRHTIIAVTEPHPASSDRDVPAIDPCACRLLGLVALLMAGMAVATMARAAVGTRGQAGSNVRMPCVAIDEMLSAIADPDDDADDTEADARGVLGKGLLRSGPRPTRPAALRGDGQHGKGIASSSGSTPTPLALMISQCGVGVAQTIEQPVMEGGASAASMTLLPCVTERGPPI